MLSCSAIYGCTALIMAKIKFRKRLFHGFFMLFHFTEIKALAWSGWFSFARDIDSAKVGNASIAQL